VKKIIQLFAAALLLALSACSDSSKPAVAPRPVFVAEAQSIGTSMLPTFGEKEQVALELCRVEDLVPGNTIIFWHEETRQFVHHRLEHRDPTTGLFRTRGDNNPNHDRGFFTPSNFVGRTHRLKK